MRIIATLLTLVTLMLLALGALTVPAWAGAPEVQVEVIPTSVEVPSQGEAEVLVVARNPITDVLRDVQLTYFTDTGVDVTVEAPSSNVLVPYGALAWTLRLSQTGEGPVMGTVHLRIDYTWQGEGEAGAVPCVAHGSLEVKSREHEPAEEVAEVQANTALEKLMEHRPGIVYLVVTNKSDVPIQVTKILLSRPEFITYTVDLPEAGVTLAPRELHAFPLKIKVIGKVRPGKHLLLFEVAIEWKKAGRPRTGKAIATHQVEVGILGESEILTVLGVPSFLVLPGFLMTMTVGLLWRFVAPRTEDFPFMKVRDAGFWLVAITLSLLTTRMYPVVTGWHGDSRNLLEGYELSDVSSVWFASIILPAVVYFVAAGGINLRTRIVEWYQTREARGRTPSSDDLPVTILRKLARQNLGVWRDRVEVEIGGEVLYAYLLEPQREGQQKIWVGPRIIVTWPRGGDQELKRKVNLQLRKGGDAAVLANLLEEGTQCAYGRPLTPRRLYRVLANLLEKGRQRAYRVLANRLEKRRQRDGPVLAVDWPKSGQLRVPYEVRIEDLGEKRDPNPIVIVE